MANWEKYKFLPNIIQRIKFLICEVLLKKQGYKQSSLKKFKWPLKYI